MYKWFRCGVFTFKDISIKGQAPGFKGQGIHTGWSGVLKVAGDHREFDD